MKEDDIWPSPDFYSFSDWVCRTVLPGDPRILLVNAHNHHSREFDLKSVHELQKARFAPRGWIVSRENWSLMDSRWTIVKRKKRASIIPSFLTQVLLLAVWRMGHSNQRENAPRFGRHVYRGAAD